MENQSEIIGNLGSAFIGFWEKLLNLFLVEGASVETQQLIKILILFIILLSIIGTFIIVFKFLKIWVESMEGRSEYIFFIIMTVLVFTFTSDFSFKGACLAIFFFYYWNQYISQSLSKSQNINKKSMQAHTNQKIRVAQTAKLAARANRKL